LPTSALGSTVTADTTLGFSVYAYDNYFTGTLTDAIENMVFTPSKPRFDAVGLSGGSVLVAPHAKVKVPVIGTPANGASSPSQTGFLLQYRDSEVKNESQVVEVR
jgi:hypothetical protein